MANTRRLLATAAVFLFIMWPAFSQDTWQSDPYGGDASVQWEQAGFFRVHSAGDKWWFVTPDGHPFLSIGVCSVQELGQTARGLGYAPYEQNMKRLYGTVERWKEVTLGRLRSWGFNTIGGWGRRDMGLPYVIVLGCSGGHWLKGRLPDFFSDEFTSHVKDMVSKRTAPEDKMLIGYFLDNEMQWDTDWRVGPPIFDGYVSLPAEAAGKRELVHFFEKRYPTIQEFGKVWTPAIATWAELAGLSKITSRSEEEPRARADRDAFTLMVARQYFRVCTETLRKADPNHLILGVRFVCWTTPEVVVRACGEFCDVVSVNFYELGPLGHVAYFVKSASTVTLAPCQDDFRRFHELGGKPILITEFSFRSDDSGLPNSFPPPIFAQPTAPTQTARGQRYEDCVRRWAGTDYFLGYHWFCYMDEPKEGRTLDGENGNYGLVNIEDQPYQDFIGFVTSANRVFWQMRLSGVR